MYFLVLVNNDFNKKFNHSKAVARRLLKIKKATFISYG